MMFFVMIFILGFVGKFVDLVFFSVSVDELDDVFVGFIYVFLIEDLYE